MQSWRRWQLNVDFKVPAKFAVWFLETDRFLPVSIRVPWFLFWFWMQKRCCTLKSNFSFRKISIIGTSEQVQNKIHCLEYLLWTLGANEVYWPWQCRFTKRHRENGSAGPIWDWRLSETFGLQLLWLQGHLQSSHRWFTTELQQNSTNYLEQF